MAPSPAGAAPLCPPSTTRSQGPPVLLGQRKLSLEPAAPGLVGLCSERHQQLPPPHRGLSPAPSFRPPITPLLPGCCQALEPVTFPLLAAPAQAGSTQAPPEPPLHPRGLRLPLCSAGTGGTGR